MTKEAERNIFLKYVADIYYQNPDLPVNRHTIYDKLRSFNTEENSRTTIANDNLAPVQVALNNKYKNNEKAVSFTANGGYFWAIENREGKNDRTYYNEIVDSIKLYIAVEPENLYQISSTLFDFMLKENIEMQSKIAKEMRNDVLVCRVLKKEDVSKVKKFINEDLNYKSKIKPNPFILNDKNVSMTYDGNLSYNFVLSIYIELYLENKREKNELNNVNDKDLAAFINETIEQAKDRYNPKIAQKFELFNYRYYLDFLKISYILRDNINNTLSMNKISKYQNIRTPKEVEMIQEFTDEDKEKVIHIINKLTYYYSLDEIHKRIMNYIETEDINQFTRRNNIRKTVSENFTPSLLKNILKEMGWNALLDVSNETYQKYGKEQLIYAVNKLIQESKIDAFTNNNDSRSYLGYIIPLKLLRNLLDDKIKEENTELTKENLTNIILNNIEKEETKKHGRN